MEKDLTMFEKIDIKSMIYEIRGKQVMLDSDVAFLYGYETRQINTAVKRNTTRFPINFCFQLTTEEHKEILRSQNEILGESGAGKHRKYLPHVFTEQGIAMLSGLLKNDVAIDVSIKIMNTFVEMRKFILENKYLLQRVITIENKIDNKFTEHDNKFDIIFNELQKEETINQKVFYEGQIYDAHSLMVGIIKNAKKNIVLIDNYVDITILDLLSKKNKDVFILIITDKSKSKLLDLDINKFNTQYPKLIIKYSSDYHDRFIIIDNETIYHCGASLKDLGKKSFAITKMEDKSLLDRIK